LGAVSSALITEIEHVCGIRLESGSLRRLGGGDIASSYRAADDKGKPYVLKVVPEAYHRMSTSEAEGLRELGRFGGDLIIPRLFGYGESNAGQWLLMEFLQNGPAKADSYEMFGRMLAQLHLRAQSDRFGFHCDTYLGFTLQKNELNTSWIEFFRKNRLGLLFETAADKNLLDTQSLHRISHLLGELEEHLHEPESASLIHGDLWGGNHMFDPEGRPILIDPAAYYGDREADLAMTRLFGSFPEAFYLGYQDEFPLVDGHRRRAVIYRLYHALNHLCMFGTSYRSLVRSTLNSYTW
jgi:fructosamine-3-kinase